MVSGRWTFRTRAGVFSIAPVLEGRSVWWAVVHDGDELGRYETPEAALDDLVGGHTYTPSNGVDTSTLGLPDELSEWAFARS